MTLLRFFKRKITILNKLRKEVDRDLIQGIKHVHEEFLVTKTSNFYNNDDSNKDTKRQTLRLNPDVSCDIAEGIIQSKSMKNLNSGTIDQPNGQMKRNIIIHSKWDKKIEPVAKKKIKSIDDYTPETMEAGLDHLTELINKTGLSRKEAIKKYNMKKSLNLI